MIAVFVTAFSLVRKKHIEIASCRLFEQVTVSFNVLFNASIVYV